MRNQGIEVIQINITGEDRPGVTSALMDILAFHEAFILDIGQANIHQSLSLGILVMTNISKTGDIMKELLLKAYELDINIKFTPVAIDEYDKWVALKGKNRNIITLLGRKITAKQIAEVTKIISSQKLNIDSIHRLTGRIPIDIVLRASKSCIELSVRGTPIDRSKMQLDFMNLANKLEIDISLQLDDMYRRCRRLICFDMDSTLISTEVIDELADRANVGKEVREITESAMRGEIDFSESFRMRIAMLKGLDESVLEDVARNLPITEGLERLMCALKRVGFRTAILSGGFTYFGEYLRKQYGFDYVYANELEIIDGKLTGNYIGEIVDGKRKAELLKLIAQVENINIAQTIAVGDGANDLPMLNIAGLGVAFHAKPKVKENTQQSLSTIGIDGILYFLGLKDNYIEE